MTQGQRAQAGVCEAGQLAVPGLEALREIHAGRSPQPSIHRWSGRKLTALQHGEASIAMPASGWFCGPKGRLHSGDLRFPARYGAFVRGGVDAARRRRIDSRLASLGVA
jgi:hypothetical protein